MNCSLIATTQNYLTTSQISLITMAVFSWLGSTTTDIKIYFLAVWFLKSRMCDVTAATPYLSLGPPAHLLNSLTRQPSSLHCFVPTLQLNNLFSYKEGDDDNIAVQEGATTLTVKYCQVQSPG